VLSLKHFEGGGEPPLVGFSYARFVVARIFRIWVPYVAAMVLCISVYNHAANTWVTRPPTTEGETRIWNRPLSIALIRHDADILWPRIP